MGDRNAYKLTLGWRVASRSVTFSCPKQHWYCQTKSDLEHKDLCPDTSSHAEHGLQVAEHPVVADPPESTACSRHQSEGKHNLAMRELVKTTGQCWQELDLPLKDCAGMTLAEAACDETPGNWKGPQAD